MSIRFSRVKAKTEGRISTFLVGGVPTAPADLEGWTAYREYLRGSRGDEQITACVETFVYGDGEPFDATPEEVAYIYMRAARRPDFIEARTKKVADSKFSISL